MVGALSQAAAPACRPSGLASRRTTAAQATRRQPHLRPAARPRLQVLASNAGNDHSPKPLSVGSGFLASLWSSRWEGKAALAIALPIPLLAFGGGGGKGGFGGEGGGGGDGDGSWGPALPEIADVDDDEEVIEEYVDDDDDEDMAAPTKTGADEDDEGYVDTKTDEFYCDDIAAEGLPVGQGIPTADELFAGLKCQAGFKCNRAELSEDLRTLLQSGLFDNVDARVTPIGNKGKSRLTFVFSEKIWPPMTEFAVDGASILPKDIPPKVMDTHPGGPTTVQTLAAIKNIVEGWYQDRGYAFGYISHFDGMDTGEIVANVVEGRVDNINVVYVDDMGHPRKSGGETDPDIVLRELPFKPGQLYNTEDGRRALRDIFALQMFDNVQVVPRANPRDEKKVDVDVMLKERPMKTAEVECEWAIAPGDRGQPSLVSIVPGGQLLFEHRNLGKKGRTLSASVSSQNFILPADDLGFRVDYRHPYIYGADDPNRAALGVTAFNSRKLSGVFTPGPGGDEVPAVWVDRMGGKVSVHETYSRNSKGTMGVVFEEVATRDDSGSLCTHCTRQLPMGQLAGEGPPTTLSDTGVDRLMFLQGNLTRDTTYFVNGAVVGARDIFQVDQGLGVGSASPFFNRHMVTFTRFIKLKSPKPNSVSPPLVAVAHARYGGCIGDMASYDYFTIGGPHSIRGYNVGEVAACRQFVEVSGELRVPVMGQHAYGFYEFGSDLGSSKDLRGNPTEYFRRAGSGVSLGGGVKLGPVRMEYAKDCNAGKGNFFLRFGERY